MGQKAWERAMGMHGYTGSPAEAEDRAMGLKPGGRCLWLAEGDPEATISRVEVDADGDPVFHLTFAAELEHRDVHATRDEIAPIDPEV